jgi:hypothetical protein
MEPENNDNCRRPRWATKINDWDKWPHKHEHRHRKKSDFGGAIVINLIVLYLINKIPGWNLCFITDGFQALLWIINLNLVIRIAGNIILLIHDQRVVYRFIQLVFHVAEFVMLLSVYYIYPFQFSVCYHHWVDVLIKLGLILSLIFTGISVIGLFFKLVFGNTK